MKMKLLCFDALKILNAVFRNTVKKFVIKQTCNHKCRSNSTLMHRGWHVWWVSVDNAVVTVALFSLKKVAALSRARGLPFSSMKD